MSRSYRGEKSLSEDFSKKYKCNRKYNAGTGAVPKSRANYERRAAAREAERQAHLLGEDLWR